MPRVVGDSRPSSCRETEAGSRRVYIYTPALDGDSGWSSNHYVGEREPDQVTIADASGRYEVELPPGEYSVLVEDGDQKYCGRRFDSEAEGRTRSCPVTVEPDRHQRFDVIIDHAGY